MAIKQRDRVAVAALRSALAAIENAEAVERGESVDRRLGIEQIPVGVGAAEVARRELTELDVLGIVRAEIADRESAALGYERAGRSGRRSASFLDTWIPMPHSRSSTCGDPSARGAGWP